VWNVRKSAVINQITNKQQETTMNYENKHTYEGRLAFFHPTTGGKGSALRFDFRPARRDREGYFFAEMAPQKSLPQRQGGTLKAATFDWDNKLIVKLGFTDICAMQAVLEGLTLSAGGERGLYHQAATASSVITFKKAPDNNSGFVFEISRKANNSTDKPQRQWIQLSAAEGCALRHIFGASFFHLCFYQVAIPTKAENVPDEA